MGSLNLAAVTPDTPYIKKIKAALEKGTGDKIPIVEVKKVQRKGGVSTSPVFFRFAGGQELVLYVRASADAAGFSDFINATSNTSARFI